MAVDGVAVESASKAFGGVQALADVTVHAQPGEVVAIVGPSGCGKTTLLELVCGLQDPDEGRVAAPPAALMPQRDQLFPWLDALDNAALALRVAGVGRSSARRRAAEHFDEFGLAGFERARVSELSGGMRQRVAFVRTLLAGRPLLCLDEPFAALDALTRAQLQGWLSEALEHEPRTVLLVTHDVEEAALLSDRIVLLSPRPARVIETFDVDIPRPRARREVGDLREAALVALGAGDPAPDGATR
jgi:ABC-type nitrate/sulfonate/bicarbonate transport system ATPase subunit